MSPFVIAISLMTGLSVGFALWSFISIYLEAKNRPRDSRLMIDPPPAMLRLLMPLGAPIAGAAYEYIKRVKKKKGAGDSSALRFHNEIERQLLSAGVPTSVRPSDMLGAAFSSALFGAGLGVYASVLQDYPPGPVVFVTSLVGAFLPFIWLNDRLKRRQLIIRKELPYMLDLLTLCVESGLDFTTALTRIVPRMNDTPLRYEVDIVQNELRIGKSRKDALRDMAWRINLIEVTTVVNGIVQSDELGSSLGPILRIQSEEARRRRSQRAEELALKAPVKIIFPLVAFIFPTTFIVIFGPIAIRYIIPLFN